MLHKNSLKFNVAMNIILTVSSMIFPLITFKYASGILTPEGTGKVAFANSIINYFVMAAMMGIPTYGIRTCAVIKYDRAELSKTAAEIFIINIFTAIVAYMIFALVLLKVPKIMTEWKLFCVGSMSIILNVLAFEWLYKALECYKYITVRSLAFKIIALVAMLITVKNVTDYIWYALVVVIANSGYAIVNFINIHKYIDPINIKKLNLKRHIKPIFVFFGMVVAVSIYTSIDTTMLGFICGDIEVGYYDVAVKVKVILVNVITAAGAVLLPRAAQYIKNDNKIEFNYLKKRAIAFALFIAVPSVIFFSLFADKVIMLFSDESYLPAASSMRIIMPTLILIGLSNIFGIQVLIPMGKEKTVLISEITGAVIDIIFNAIFIPIYGAEGAAFGTVCAEAAVLLVQLTALRENIFNDLKEVNIIKILSAASFAGATAYALTKVVNTGYFISLCVAAISYSAVFSVLLIILKDSIMKELTNYLKVIINKYIVKINNRNFWEKASIVAIAVYVFTAIVFDSMYAKIAGIDSLFTIIRTGCYGIILAKGGIDLLSGRYLLKEIVLDMTVAALLLITAIKSGIKNPLIYWIFIVVAHDTDYRKILKYTALMHAVALLFVVGSAYAGIIENYHVSRHDGTIRYGLGFQYVTLSANYFLYFVFLWVVYRRERIHLVEVVVMLAVQIILYIKTDTKSAFIFGTVCLLGAIILKVSKILRKWHKPYMIIALLAAPITALITLLITYKYNDANKILFKLNRLVTGRLRFGKLGIEQFGITPFGQAIEWHAGTITDGSTYNYVDSSYIQILLNYGVVIFIAVIMFFVIFGWLISKKRDTWMLWVLGLIILHSAMDPQLIVFAYDSMLFIFAYKSTFRSVVDWI